MDRPTLDPDGRPNGNAARPPEGPPSSADPPAFAGPPPATEPRAAADGSSAAAPPALVHVAVDGLRRCGQWVDLRDTAVDAGALAGAVADPESSDAVTVRCAAPGPLFEHVGVITPGAHLDRRVALATLAKQRGHGSARESALAAVRDELAALALEPCDASDARRAVADAGGAERELEERVATLRGRLRERRSDSPDSQDDEELAETLASTVRELSEHRTERIAAEQRLARERERARTVRNVRERRLELQDRERNLERAIRADLAEAVYPAFVEALAAVPGTATPGSRPAEFRGDDVTAALALARLSSSAAPVVLAVDRFASPAAAARRLGRPVLRV